MVPWRRHISKIGGWAGRIYHGLCFSLWSLNINERHLGDSVHQNNSGGLETKPVITDPLRIYPQRQQTDKSPGCFPLIPGEQVLMLTKYLKSSYSTINRQNILQWQLLSEEFSSFILMQVCNTFGIYYYAGLPNFISWVTSRNFHPSIHPS